MEAATEAALLARRDIRRLWFFADGAEPKPEDAPAWAAGAAAAATSGNPHGQDMAARAIACAGPGSWQVAFDKERAAQAASLRHIVASPFRPIHVPANLPTTVIALAEALYAGEPCAYALRDSLLEAGLIEIAEHFREAEHPKGCAWLDGLLRKQ